MKDIRKEPYAEWLESVLSSMVEEKPVRIALAMECGDGNTCTAYWKCNQQDIALLSHTMYMDAVFRVMKANAKEIIQAAEEDEEENATD